MTGTMAPMFGPGKGDTAQDSRAASFMSFLRMTMRLSATVKSPMANRIAGRVSKSDRFTQAQVPFPYAKRAFMGLGLGLPR
jgi:hypothetical protein